MLRYTLYRLLFMIPTFIGMSLVVFILMHRIPGSPFDNPGSSRALSAEQLDNINKVYGLDKPLWQQYLRYVGNLLRFDLGESYARRGQKVRDIIAREFPVSLKVGLIAVGVAVVFGLALGTLAASRQNSVLDYVVSFLSTLGIAFPNYIIGVFIVWIFVLNLKWLPHTGGLEEWRDWIAPVVALSLGPMGTIARYTRSSMIEVIRSDFVRTARAKGATEQRVMIRHVLKNGLIPPLTIIGPLFAAIGTGSPAVETVFRIPGIGKYFADSIIQRDYSMIMAIILLFGMFLAFMNLVVDLLYGVVDPRIRYS